MGLLNEKYINQYEELHNSKEDFGTSSLSFIEEICFIINIYKPKTILDYGCGKGVLADKLQEIYKNKKIYKYDPAIKEYSKIPVNKVDMVINTDVLEHIPEQDIPNILEHISSICRFAYFNLHHAKAQNILPNGENAHCTVKDPDWYDNIIGKYFKNITHLSSRNSYNTVVITKKLNKKNKKKYYEIIDKPINYDLNIIRKSYIKFLGVKLFEYKLLSSRDLTIKILNIPVFKRKIKNNFTRFYILGIYCVKYANFLKK
ncbi:MAG: class I SAM-dependent methyltransferase [Alphaproteobacteria bacterium]|nr:class I SAM-dependent methyltransferase [Alphaproteobacteria bacterium]